MKTLFITLLIFCSFTVFGQKVSKLKIDLDKNGVTRNFNKKNCKDSVYFIKERDSILVDGKYQYGYRLKVIDKSELNKRKLKYK